MMDHQSNFLVQMSQVTRKQEISRICQLVGFFIKTKWYDAKLQPQVMKTRYKQELQKTITFTHNVSVKSTIFSIHISQNLRFYTIYIKQDGLMAI